ncbi:MAG: endonuclease/exonuclease/phosphatase family protein [Verrucomicrobia bacterium]|nr:endonuclease/exonuclease/phosphatase family protein [Verrucomicrobiota bacterium]
MISSRRAHSRVAWAVLLASAALLRGAEIFHVATYNVENYVDAAGSRPPKPAAAKAAIRESIRALRPDVLALQEIGSTNALLELRAALKAEGLDFPHWEHVAGFDTNIYVAVLSRFPIVARRPHSRESFLLHGRRFRVSRGFAEVDIQAAPKYSFTLIAAHLKSRRPIAEADEAEMREQEALILRGIIDARLRVNPDANLVVLGDLNDVKDSRSTRIIIGRGRGALTDTRPAERNGDNQPSAVPGYGPRNITWTHFYGKEDTYSRIDYILLSRGMAREWNTNGTFVLMLPNWGVASDHRPIVASFFAEER